MEHNLSAYYTYHNFDHTQYVLEKSIFIAEIENIPKDDVTLLKIAALYHDIGFTLKRENHEETGIQIASTELLELGFGEADIEKISGMIMATKIPQRPKNILEKIIADADLEYLGTDKFDEFGQKLFREMKYFQPTLTPTQWLEIQIEFLSNHSYHTNYCRKFTEPVKQIYLEQLKAKVKLIY
ncbi:MAG: HD domain-containing protein [Bacteroidota bacterium]|jgi:uncharacterized protein|nr:HD domain-containing protein [Bacteroidota bacterium]